MMLEDYIYPRVRMDWQIHLWEHPAHNSGCIVASTTGNTELISLDLARLLRRMTGDKSVADLMSDLAGPGASPDAREMVRPMLTDIVCELYERDIVETAPSPFPARAFVPANPHEHLLRVMQLQLTNQCNLVCDHCYAGSHARGHRGFSLEQIQSIVDEFADLGGIRLFLTGGEALLRPDLEDIVVYAKQRQLFVYLNTNGFSVTPERAERLVRLGVGAVNISLDGANAATHDAFRRRAGAFDRALTAIDRFQEHNIPVAVQMTVHKGNLDQGPALFDAVSAKGVAEVYFVRMVPQGRGRDFSELVPSADEFHRSMFDTELHRYQPRPTTTPVREPIRKGTRCTAATAQLYVRADGACFPCTSLDYDRFCMGHYPKASIEQIWTRGDGPQNDLREFSHGSIAQCGTCSRQPVCKGGCAGNALSLRGDWRLSDPNGCIMRDVRKEVAAAYAAGAQETTLSS